MFILFCCIGNIINAQDIHFSQYNASPLNLNPALTGFFDEDYRFTLNHRQQWRSVTVPYQTISASIDRKIINDKSKKDIYGFGLQINRDKAGDSEFGIIQALLSFAYTRSLNKANTHYLSFGFNTGPAQRTINYSKLTFDNQWDGSMYNPDLSTGETFNINDYFFFDVAIGANWFGKLSDDLNVNLGTSYSHLNEPLQSLFNNPDIRLDKKLTGHLSFEYHASDKIVILPTALYLNQGPLQEITFGLFGRYVKEDSKYNYLAFNIGNFYRNKDAYVIVLGIDYKKISFGISYDLNLSTLKPASNLKGGYELSLQYKISTKKYSYKRQINCLIF